MIYQMQMPAKIEVDEATHTDRFGRFVAQPLERGYGVTLGNVMRRALLASLPGTAITGLKIDGVFHEFSTINGVREDVPEIVLNLKKVRFRSNCKRNCKTSLVLNGQKEFTAGDIIAQEGEFEVLNKDLHIATVNEGATLKIDIFVGRGRGYLPSEENRPDGMPIGFIAIDAIFTPIRNVKFTVENTRVGQRTDYEKMILDVETDGSITPDDSISLAGKIINEHVTFFADFSPTEEEFTEEEFKQQDDEFENMRKLFNTKIEDLDLSVRSHNCLRLAEIDTIGDLVSRKEDELLNYKNFGKKSLTELKEQLEKFDLKFGMDITKYQMKG
ncbi:MAG: DNA-directed RNA polymerase subunit alpha [Chlorobium limicola]|uniref:DNA-directed RNA polymerase subunit alpha n=2 Tax=Chlorobium limicola TaxID=1092 RepID=RPOA_CHLL2|nr:DNA-directed RNA polymerase subunit alpha [Chlorobium limicola]B3EGW3.1 RecName: Full=DNA-directed RNA polymerase subunit alpha; Short=RNAP subunit alpha; AltName: Full=RNA polymerase subunit alpha; AltName: Full=Transcriptase subunit alpha [Chlorobium limicola DSM 245]ACD91226.1 DNA-directed RNA polymerase, alpha subunit [Chlorobium limicola DSM 245]KUL20257.1 DNA-directed RNA polymerase subunit alpha [Chlorobium limicola]NTV20130.1 DNA-directed RNA polymerase subunit alpha [Chlorobium limi